MFDRIKQSLVPPVLEGEAKTEVANWLNAILIVLLIATAIAASFFVAFGSGGFLLITTISGAFHLVLLVLVRRGHVRVVSILLVLQLLGVATWSAHASDGINAGAASAYFLVLVIAAFLLGENGVLIAALLSIVALWGLFWARVETITVAGVLPDQFLKLTIMSLMLGATAIVLRFTIRRLNQALERAHWNEHALAESNRELGTEIAARRHAEEEAQRRALEQETLREAALALTTTLDRNEVIDRILAQLQEVVPYDTASVQLLRRDHLEIVGGRGFPNLEEIVGITFDPSREDNPNHEVVRTRAPFIVEDAPTVYEEFSRDPHAPAGIRSWLGVPMLVGEQLIGMIALDKSEPGFYTEEHARLAEVFAAQAAVAVENSRLFEAARRRADELARLHDAAAAISSSLEPREVLHTLAEQMGKAPNVTRAYICDADEHMMTTTVLAEWVGPEALDAERGSDLDVTYDLERFPSTLQALQERQPLVFQTADPNLDPADHGEAERYSWKSNLVIPLMTRDCVIGYAELWESRWEREFTEAEVRLCQTLAADAAVAIEHARLFQAEREQRELTEALEKAAAAVSSTLDPDQVLDRILEQVERVVAGEAFVIISLKDDIGRVVRWRVHEHLGVEQHLPHLVLPVDSYANLAKMKRTGRPLVISDTPADPNWVEQEGWEWIRAYVGVPIQLTGATIGFLAVYGTRPGQFSPADGRRLEAFASHAAAAIENARLHQQVLDHAGRLEQRVQERTAELQAQYARSDAILNSTTDGVVVTDTKGNITQANPVAQAWLTQTLSPEETGRLREAIEGLAQRADEMPELVLELTGLDLELSAAPVVEEGTEESSVVVAIHDVSHLKALDRMKTQLVTNVSHELRTPITTIKLYADLMQRLSPEDERWRQYLDTLAQEADRQAQLVQDILQISRIDAGRLEMKPSPTSLDELTGGIVASHRVLAQEAGLSLEYQPMVRSGTEPELVALVDPVRMIQVLNNLVGNAIRYTPKGGRVVISTGEQEAEGRTWATVTVSDTGIGIPEDELPHVFDRFFRGKEPWRMQLPGTGLGLSIAKEIVELHGGRVTVESPSAADRTSALGADDAGEEGAGSTFTIWLPLAG